MYGTVQYFDGRRGMVISTDSQVSAFFDAAAIVGDPAHVRHGETVCFDATRPDGHAIVAVNVRRA